MKKLLQKIWRTFRLVCYHLNPQGTKEQRDAINRYLDVWK